MEKATTSIPTYTHIHSVKSEYKAAQGPLNLDFLEHTLVPTRTDIHFILPSLFPKKRQKIYTGFKLNRFLLCVWSAVVQIILL